MKKHLYSAIVFALTLAPMAASAALINPLGNGVTLESFIGRLIKGILGLSGSVALAMFVWGGLQYMLAGGNDTKVKKAKETLTNAGLGLAIIFFAYTLVSAVIKLLAGGSLS